MTERALQTWIFKQLKAIEAAGVPILWEKRHGSAYQHAGKADLMILLNGRHAEIELKGQRGKISAAQKIWMSRAAAAGAEACIVRTREQIVAMLNELIGFERFRLVRSGSGWRIEVR